ncbi:16S rRNA (guanine(527)-N(7))-methyltransferase RsmG [Erythrobacter sp. LQ02-29]|uniref:16S rRNA (guanine(527)-N(7))-methyltransferase RsmG n=1 Tax=Erythrobacter sp. LQ02-29 TaxID=2920384 RepID=UPI001F4DBC28|nr:16S rRNA (guanine(527)-N(7))-methyltransferase RsmG [Erythrobacter sp. LQ02-29]MCP9221833.1 16S rRNA (guanine(527)-N(7))-methyltransferase RsmG [Erythrobacter sp. LQ02-29]
MIEDEVSAREYVARWGDDAAMERLDTLVAHLGVENRRQNLVSEKTLAEVWQRHIADSAQLLEYVPRGTSPWLDLGSGAGFPGLVLAALQPELPIYLVESRRRRIEWLEQMRDVLDLPKCEIVGQRVETIQPIAAGAITARAFAPLERLLALSAEFSTPSTHWVLPKGRSARQELESLEAEWGLRFHVEPSLTHSESAILVGKGVAQKRKRA